MEGLRAINDPVVTFLRVSLRSIKREIISNVNGGLQEFSIILTIPPHVIPPRCKAIPNEACIFGLQVPCFPLPRPAHVLAFGPCGIQTKDTKTRQLFYHKVNHAILVHCHDRVVLPIARDDITCMHRSSIN
jgi:hypothetical protein